MRRIGRARSAPTRGGRSVATADPLPGAAMTALPASEIYMEEGAA